MKVDIAKAVNRAEGDVCAFGGLRVACGPDLPPEGAH